MTDRKNTTTVATEEERQLIRVARTHGHANTLRLLKDISAGMPAAEAEAAFIKRSRKRERDTRRRRPMVVPVTPDPRRIMRPYGSEAAKEDVDAAVLEAEFLARILEHEKVTPKLVNTIRFLVAGACLYVAKELDTHQIDPQLVRDILPYASAVNRPFFRQAFEWLIEDVRRDAPRLLPAMLGKGKKGGGEQ